MRKFTAISCAALALASALAAGAAGSKGFDARRYLQCRSGEIQLLPALGVDEMRKGHKENLEALGGFVFNLEWNENKMTKMRVLSKEGGVCRVRSYGAIGSPLMRKAKGRCTNAAIASTEGQAVPDGTPESCFERAKNPLPSVCLEFDTEPGEILEFQGQSGNQDWTDYAAHLDERFLKTAEAARIAQNVIDWQLDSGGWPKNVPMHDRLSAKERRAVLAMKGERKLGTIDNAATFTELKFLARMYKAAEGRQGTEKYLAAVKKGIEFLVGMQYPNGGWPQCDPAKVGYWHQITYNDGAMVNAMNMMRDVYEGRAPFDIPLPDELRAKCRRAFDRGIECILKTQIRQDGKLSLWCQQHDRDTLAPCVGRSFELPAVCTYESADIVALLMDVDATRYPAETAARIRESIEGAVAWYKAHAIRGYRVEDGFRREDGIVTSRLVRVPEAESNPLWCRYYTLEDNRPFTGRRDGTMNFDFSELERGENMSYKWFSDVGTRVEKMHAKWLEREAARARRAELRKNAKTTEWRGGKGSGGVPNVLPDRDTWENAENWSNGAPQSEDTVVFAKDATIWTMSSAPYECAKLVLRGKPRLTLQSHYEANNAVNPSLRPSAIEGEGMIELNRFGLESREDERLVVPESVAIEANPREGAGSWIGSTGRGRVQVKGEVACPGNRLRLRGDIEVEKSVERGVERIEAEPSVKFLNPPKVEPLVLECAAGESLQGVLSASREDGDIVERHAVHAGRKRRDARDVPELHVLRRHPGLRDGRLHRREHGDARAACGDGREGAGRTVRRALRRRRSRRLPPLPLPRLAGHGVRRRQVEVRRREAGVRRLLHRGDGRLHLRRVRRALLELRHTFDPGRIRHRRFARGGASVRIRFREVPRHVRQGQEDVAGAPVASVRQHHLHRHGLRRRGDAPGVERVDDGLRTARMALRGIRLPPERRGQARRDRRGRRREGAQKLPRGVRLFDGV